MDAEQRLTPRALVCAAMAVVLAACVAAPPQNLSTLGPTESDVRAQLGEPVREWPALPVPAGHAAAGEKVLEYTWMPSGSVNLMVRIAPDGRVTGTVQTLGPETFDRIQKGQSIENVLRLLGRPMSTVSFPLTGQAHYTWRFNEGPNRADLKLYAVQFDADGRVMSAQTQIDPDTYRRFRSWRGF